MKIIVAITNHGTSNERYLRQLIASYSAMPYEVHLVVLSNIPKDLGPGIEVIVGAPTKNPWSLPFGHKQLFAQRIDQYDLFIYSEDDTLVSHRNIEAFLNVTPFLRENEIAGFLRFELASDGKMYFPEAHSHFHWRPNSLRQRGPYSLASFSNEHAACYVLTRDQLRRAIASGGFVVNAHEGHYDMLVTAATDPYTQCGFTKLICISHLEDFFVHHLPNKYLGAMGLESKSMLRQIEAMRRLENGTPSAELFPIETRIFHTGYSPDYYAAARPEVIDAIPYDADSLLSVGCGWGATEQHLLNRGLRVVAIPLDPIIATEPRSRGVETLCGSLQETRSALSQQRFDCILFQNVLQVAPDPIATLHLFAGLLTDRGAMVITIPNLNRLQAWRWWITNKPGYRQLGDYSQTGLHPTTRHLVSRWLKAIGLHVDKITSIIPDARKRQLRWLGALGAELLATDHVLIARRQPATMPVPSPACSVR